MYKKKEHSDGYWHARLSLAFIPIAAVIGAAAIFIPLAWWERLSLSALGCLMGIVLPPDLDQDSWVTATRIWFRIPLVGWIIGYAYSFYFYPYAYNFKHRGISHHPVWGTLTRIGYILIWTPIFLSLLKLGVLVYLQDSISLTSLAAVFSGWFLIVLGNIWQGVCLAIGVYASDISHVLRDKRGWQI